MEDKRLIGFYDYTVILTYLGMLFAFTGIILALNFLYTECIICLMLSGLCDMFDGAVASTKNRNQYEKEFGIQIDSLSDLISFGVLPAIFLYMITDRSSIAVAISAAYVLAALIRLAYFNVQESKRQKETCGKRESYLGIPVTTVAIVLPLVYMVYDFFKINTTIPFMTLTALLAIGFVSRIEIKKPKLIGKIVMIVLGTFEMLGVFFLTGADVL